MKIKIINETYLDNDESSKSVDAEIDTTNKSYLFITTTGGEGDFEKDIHICSFETFEDFKKNIHKYFKDNGSNPEYDEYNGITTLRGILKNIKDAKTFNDINNFIRGSICNVFNPEANSNFVLLAAVDLSTTRSKSIVVDMRYQNCYDLEDARIFDKEFVSNNGIEKALESTKDFVKFDEYSLSRNYKLSENFIRKFQNRVDWYGISSFQKLSEDFIREFQDKVRWANISSSQKLSESFIREFQDKVDWGFISYHQKLSEDFIREFQYKVDWKSIFRQQVLSDNFKEEFKNEI